jgi:hypothetical protein
VTRVVGVAAAVEGGGSWPAHTQIPSWHRATVVSSHQATVVSSHCGLPQSSCPVHVREVGVGMAILLAPGEVVVAVLVERGSLDVRLVDVAVAEGIAVGVM